MNCYIGKQHASFRLYDMPNKKLKPTPQAVLLLWERRPQKSPSFGVGLTKALGAKEKSKIKINSKSAWKFLLKKAKAFVVFIALKLLRAEAWEVKAAERTIKNSNTRNKHPGRAAGNCCIEQVRRLWVCEQKSVILLAERQSDSKIRKVPPACPGITAWTSRRNKLNELFNLYEPVKLG